MDRIEEIRKREFNFPKDTMRWRDYFVEKVHISKVVFQDISDESLIKEFERLIIRCSKQM